MRDVRTELRRASRLIEAPDGSFERLGERRERSRRRGRVGALALAAAVTAISLGGIAVLATRLGGGSTGSGSDWEPSRRLAIQPGEYLYVRVTSDEGDDGWVRDVETWWAPDGSGEVRNRSTRQDKYPYPASGVYVAGAFPIGLHGVASLSTDPEILAGQLREAPFDWESLLLETPYATPELRAAVYEVVSGMDGVTVIEDARDPAGRPAVALERSERADGDISTWRTYFDAGTHQAIAWTFTSSRGGSAWILLESAIVDAPGEVPDLAEWLAPPVEGTEAP
jgi:hypothetical protein